MKKLKAFTLVELLVTMVISGIVIGLSSLCYEIIYKQYYNFRNVNERINTALAVKAVLNNDLHHAAFVNQKEEGVIALTDKVNTTIIYEFREAYILRKVNEVQDTFFLSTSNYRASFMGEEIRNYRALADELYFESDILNEKELFYFHKKYGADILMETDSNE